MPQSTWADPTATWADPVEVWSDEGVTSLDFKCEWSPTTAPGAAPSWEDITTLVRSGRVSRGRQSEFDRTSAGTMTLVVDNRDRLFDPEHNSNARPNRRIRVTVGSGADERPVFDGLIDAMPQTYRGPGDALVQLTATDAFKLLAKFELDEIYGPVVEADNPYLWWRLGDELPLATEAADWSGNNRPGTIKGTPTSSGSLIADGPGGMSFDGQGDNTEGSSDGVVGPGLTLATAPASVECWVRTAKYGENYSFICGQTTTPGPTTFNHILSLAMDNDTGLPQANALFGNFNKTVTGTTVLRDTGIHHLVATIDTDLKLRLYVDGDLEGVSSASSGLSMDSSGAFRVAKTPVRGETGVGTAYRSFKGEVCEVALYNTALSLSRVQAHYAAGSAPWSGDSTGERVDRILDFVGWRSDERSIETGASTLGAAVNTAGQSALDHLLAVEETEQGRFFIDGDGVATFYGRNHETSLTSQADFDAGEAENLEFDYDDSNLVNDCTVTRVGGTPQRAQDATSIAAYWRQSEVIDGVLYSSDTEAAGMAAWRVANYSQPVLRPGQLRFQPLINLPSLYPRVLARELGDRVTVTKTPLAGSDIVVYAVIEGIEHQFNGGMHWVTSWNLSPIIEGQFGPGGGGGGGGLTYLRLNDPTLGRLDNNRLGF